MNSTAQDPGFFPAGRTYKAPMLIALIMIAGLLSGVIGDGVWDAVSWLGLGTPIAILLWRLLHPDKHAAKGSGC